MDRQIDRLTNRPTNRPTESRTDNGVLSRVARDKKKTEEINWLNATVTHLQSGDKSTLRLQLEQFRKQLQESRARQRAATYAVNRLKRQVNSYREAAAQNSNKTRSLDLHGGHIDELE